MPGVLAAVRAISTRPGLTVGIEPILGSNDVNRSWTSRLRESPLVGEFTIILIVGLLLAGLDVGDRYAHRRAERQVAALLQSQLGTPQPPTVDIEEFPFLTQVAADSIGRVHVVGDQLAKQPKRR